MSNSSTSGQLQDGETTKSVNVNPLQAESIGRRSRWWFRIKAGCFAVCLSAAIGLITMAVMFIRWKREGERQLTEELAILKESKEPSTAEELEAYYSLPAGMQDTTQLWCDAAATFSTTEFLTEVTNIPVIGRAAGAAPAPDEPWKQKDEARAILVKYAGSIDQLHEAARDGGAARYPTGFKSGMAVGMTDVGNLRRAAWMLVLESNVKAHDLDSAGALRAIHTLLRLARSLDGHPQFIPYLVRISFAQIAYDLIADLLPYLDLSDDELLELSLELSNDDHDAGFHQALLGERVTGLVVYEDPKSAIAMGEVQPEMVMVFSVWKNRDQAFFLMKMRSLLDATRLTWPATFDNAKQQSKELHRLTNGGKSIRHLFSQITLNLVEDIIEANGRTNALRDATRVAIAIEQHRKKLGKAPDALNGLTPEFLDKVPLDPFDGHPLRYRADADKVVIYSVGKDQKDDGGDPTETTFADYVLSVPIVDPSARNRAR